MKTLCYLLCTILISITAQAGSGQAYMERFTAYSNWNENLPVQANDQFLAFIDSDTPLAKKLRDRWLYQLARQRDWQNYSLHYKKSNDVSLQCFALLADYYQGRQEQVFAATRILWLTGGSQPVACNMLFDLFLKSDNFNENLITQRIILALDKSNLPLVRYLLKQYPRPHLKDEKLLMLIYQNPTRITQLSGSDFQSVFYLYGLKRMVSLNMDQALKYWAHPETKKILSPSQQQAFIAHVALYKAMRNHEDASEWFVQLNSEYYSDVLLDWQIRLALKRQDWAKAKEMINHFHDKQNPCWQYWLARAEEETGNPDAARQIYEALAKTRNYYGFLSSLRLNKPFAFQNENAVSNLNLLKPYQPFLDNIRFLHNTHQDFQASRLLNDFVLELPKNDKSALILWVSKELRWHSKALYLSSTEELSNQLSLRFPLAFSDSVNQFSRNYQIPSELIYAIIRQESGFREDVVSPAGARGLMQVMPSTANQVARQKKIAYTNQDELFSSQKNINLGVAYLKHLANRFGQHPLLITAAYNAGPSQVNYWLKNHPPKQVDIWIETLPWHETRNYLKNVISFFAVYQYRMQHKSDLNAFLKPL